MIDNPAAGAAIQTACRAFDLVCHMDNHQGVAAYLQAVLSVGVAGVTAVWALVQGNQRNHDARKRWRSHLEAIIGLVDLVDSEVSRLESILDGTTKGPDDGNEMPTSRYFDPALDLVARFPRLELPSERALRGWFDLHWELRMFATSMRTVWDTRPRPQIAQIVLGEPPETRTKQVAVRVHAAAAEVKQACRAALGKPEPPRLLSDLEPPPDDHAFW